MRRLLERIRRPEYTGRNRCWPCTITNSLLLTILVGGLALVGRRAAAAIVGAVGVVSIGLRGYVVPYTPRLAPALVAALPIGYRSRETEESGSLSDPTLVDEEDASAAEPTGEDVLAALLEAGVVVSDGEELSLDPAFRDDWRREMRALRDRDLEGLAIVADRLTDPATEVRTSRSLGRSSLVLRGTGGVIALERAVAVAELAAASALESAVEDPAVRRAAGHPLRSLLEACPLCDGALEITQSSCCGEVTPIGSTPAEKLYCPDCNVRLFTFD